MHDGVPFVRCHIWNLRFCAVPMKFTESPYDDPQLVEPHGFATWLEPSNGLQRRIHIFQRAPCYIELTRIAQGDPRMAYKQDLTF